MMNEKNLRIAVIILSFILIITSAVCGFAIFHYRAELRSIREQLAVARNREQDISRAITEFDRRTSELYSQSYNNIAEIRQATALLQDYINDFISDINCADSDSFDY